MNEKKNIMIKHFHEIKKLNEEIKKQREQEETLNPSKLLDRYKFEIKSLKKELTIIKKELEKCRKQIIKPSQI